MKHQQSILLGGCLFTAVLLGMSQPPMPQTDSAPDQRTKQDIEEGAESREHDGSNADRPGRRTLEIRIDADALRARLNRSVIRAQQMLDRSQAALDKLDSGASPTEVLAEMRLSGSMIRTAPGEPEDRESRQPQQRPGGDRSPQAASPQDRREMHAFLQEHFPEFWANLKPIINSDQVTGDRLLAPMTPQIHEIMLLMESQPELGRLKIEEMRIGFDFVEASRIYRTTMSDADSTGEQKRAALSTLRARAADRFDIQLRSKQFEVQRLESRLEELKGSVDEIAQRRDDEIEHMVRSIRLIPRTRSRPHADEDD